jgi:hypothetical protein
MTFDRCHCPLFLSHVWGHVLALGIVVVIGVLGYLIYVYGFKDFVEFYDGEDR